MTPDFFARDALHVARDLLGAVLVHEDRQGTRAGVIVETEAYKAPHDKASHAFGGKRTPRTEVVFGPAGRAYVYLIYGMYLCFNITVAVEDSPEVVLLRALEPIEGLDLMRAQSGRLKDRDLCRGPGRLCRAMGITMGHYGADLTTGGLYVARGHAVDDGDVETTARVNIDYAGEFRDVPWRFLVKNSPFVSKKP